MFKVILAFILFAVYSFGDFQPTAPPQEEVLFVKKTIPYDNQYEREVNGQENDQQLKVNYEVKQQGIYIECIIKDFSFNKRNFGSVKKEGEGHIQLYINDEKVDSIYTSSFIIKDLPKGTYKVKIDLVHNDYTPYGINEEFDVTI